MIISLPSGYCWCGCIALVNQKIKDTLQTQSITSKIFINNIITIISKIHYYFTGEEADTRLTQPDDYYSQGDSNADTVELL